jgi:hypothetical protein
MLTLDVRTRTRNDALLSTFKREIGTLAYGIPVTPRSLVGLMIRRILRPVAAGLVLGFLLTRWLSNLAEAQLFQVESGDPRMLGVSGLVVIAVAILAVLLPGCASTSAQLNVDS